MSLKEQVREKALKIVGERIFEDLVDIATNDLETASKIYAMYKLKGLSIEGMYVEKLEKQGWSIDELKFYLNKDIRETIVTGPYIRYYINVVAPNRAGGHVTIKTEPPEETDMDKETWKKYVRLKEEFKQKAAPRIIELLQKKVRELQKKLEEYEKKLEECEDKLEGCGCEA